MFYAESVSAVVLKQCARQRVRAARFRQDSNGAIRIAMIAAVLLVILFNPISATAFSIDRNENHLRISGVIGDESPGVFNRNLVETLLEMGLSGDRASAVHLYLDLPKGGKAAPALRLVDLVRAAQEHGTVFIAHVEARTTCMSGCSFLFLSSDERWIAPDGRLVLHGFSNADPDHPVEVPKSFKESYYSLLRRANEPFYRFIKASRIVEDDIKVGFTGKTLFERSAFDGLITGLHLP